MGQMSLTHILLLLLIVLVFFGPSRLPGLGKSLGEAIRGFKKGLDGTDSGTPEKDNQTAQNQQQPGPTHQVSARHVSPLELPEDDRDGVSNNDHPHNTNRRS